MTRLLNAMGLSLAALVAAPSMANAVNARQAILACDKANDKKEGSCDYTVSASGDVTVTALERTGPFLRVSMYRTSEPGEGTLTLVFNNDPLELRQWAVMDAQRRETRVTLSRIETGQRFPAGLFQFNDPRFFEPGGFGAPQGSGN